jgi:hypothetical protein
VLARQDPTVLAGGGGRIAWSRWDAKAQRYHLVVTVGGRTTRLPVAPRSLWFDVSIGTTRSGALVAVYSRCAAPARQCKLFEWSFRDHRERRLRVTPPAGATSLFRPAISRGQLAYAARQRNGQTAIYLARGEGAAPTQVRLPRPGGDNPYAGVRTGDAEGLTSIALRNGVLAYTWSYAGQRPTCGQTDYTAAGPGTDTMLVVRQRSGRQTLLSHTGCDADGPAFAVYGAQWSSDGGLRWITLVKTPDRWSTSELRLRPAEGGASHLWSTHGNLVSYAQDDRGHAVGQVGRALMTMPVLP